MALGTQYPSDQVHYLRKTVTFADDGLLIKLGTLPAGAVVIGAGAVISTAFNSSVSDVLDIGFGADPDHLATALVITTAGLQAADALATATGLVTTAPTDVTATYTSGGDAPTAGSAVAFVEFMVDNTYA